MVDFFSIPRQFGSNFFFFSGADLASRPHQLVAKFSIPRQFGCFFFFFREPIWLAVRTNLVAKFSGKDKVPQHLPLRHSAAIVLHCRRN
jgi:hypothetical protein